jgi:hypothetical protein
MNASEFRIRDGMIFRRNECVGFTEGDDIYMYVNGESMKIGAFDHPAQIVGKVIEWYGPTPPANDRPARFQTARKRRYAPFR